MNFFEYIDILDTPYQIYRENIQNSSFLVNSHWHYYVEMLYIIKGEIFIHINQQHYCLGPGNFVFIPARTLHRITAGNTLPCEYIVMKFDLNTIKISRAYLPRIREMIFFISDRQNYVVSSEEMKQTTILENIDRVETESLAQRFGCELNIYSGLTSIILELVRLLEPALATDSVKPAATDTDFFSNILEYIDAHFNESLCVQELAKKSGISYSKFAQKFKQNFGRTCKEYIEYIQVTKAEEMLLYSDLDLSYIAQETGFSDLSHMIRTYKKFKQETPKQARLKNSVRS